MSLHSATNMTNLWILSAVFYLVNMMNTVTAKNVTTAFVYRSENYCKHECDPRKCIVNEDCAKLDVTMKCIGGWCSCKDNGPFNGRCLSVKKIGEKCSIAAQCSKAGGYCDASGTGLCKCYDNTIEFRKYCYKGYKANLDTELRVEIGTLRELMFYVSEKDEEYQINLSDQDEKVHIYFFNELSTWSTNSQNEVGVKTRAKGQAFDSALCNVKFAAENGFNSIKYGGDYFVTDLSRYKRADDSFELLCHQVHGIYFITPEVLNVTRKGSQAKKNLNFHPLHKKAKLAIGSLDEDCAANDDCKPLNSVCTANKCKCDDSHVKHSKNNCVPKVAGLDTSCSVFDQCSEANSVCSGKSKCECKKGFKEDKGKCVAK